MSTLQKRVMLAVTLVAAIGAAAWLVGYSYVLTD